MVKKILAAILVLAVLASVLVAAPVMGGSPDGKEGKGHNGKGVDELGMMEDFRPGGAGKGAEAQYNGDRDDVTDYLMGEFGIIQLTTVDDNVDGAMHPMFSPYSPYGDRIAYMSDEDIYNDNRHIRVMDIRYRMDGGVDVMDD